MTDVSAMSSKIGRGDLSGIKTKQGKPTFPPGERLAYPARDLYGHLGPFVYLSSAPVFRSVQVFAFGTDYGLVPIASHFAFVGDEYLAFPIRDSGMGLTLLDLKTLPDGVFACVNLPTPPAHEIATGVIANADKTDNKGNSAVRN